MISRRRHPEDDLQITCADWCRLVLAPSVIWHHSVNEGKRGRAAAGIAKAMGQRPGWPDFVFIWSDGAPLPLVAFVELKTESGRLSGNQEGFRDDAKVIGADWALCRSFEEFRAALEVFGVPLKVRQVKAGRAA